MRTLGLAVLLLLVVTSPALAATPPCRPCAGVQVSDPLAVATALAGTPKIAEDARLYVVWDFDLATGDPSSAISAAAALETAGAEPWMKLTFHAPAAIAQHLGELEAELKSATALARAAKCRHYQVLWEPSTPADGGIAEAAPSAADYAFLFKRVAVALTGVAPEVRALTSAFQPTDLDRLRAFYGEEVAAYVDGVVLSVAPEAELTAAIALLTELDPGRPVVVEGIPFPGEPTEAMSWAAEVGRFGGSVAVLDLAVPEGTAIQPAWLAPLVAVANEFAGDLSFDPYSVPQGAPAGWSYVRGSDLGLRVLVRRPPPGNQGQGVQEIRLRFNDPNLRRPSRVDLATGEASPLTGFQETASGLELTVPNPGQITLLRIERAKPEELEGGVAERVEVSSEREIPVEEILRRLQAFDDAQERKVEHFRATNTTHLRFQATAGAAGTFEATLEGDFFFRRGQGYDWAWQNFYVNGVRWRGKTLPEIPLIQPEKAAAMPLTIELSKRYSYRLRGSETVDGRDCWVVEFRPVAEAQAEAEKLFRGAVWVDKQIFARVQTRAVQLGLEGEVLSNEETVSFRPVDAQGQPAAWGPEGYFLPLTTVAQQILSILNTTTVVERQIQLSNVAINGPDFEAQRQVVLDSEATMVRDTPAGMRYLVKEEGVAERTVKEGFDTSKLFAIGGVFYDDSLDFPLPLAGLNYFSFDFRGTGAQVNAFFGGALATLDYAQPRFRGSKFDVGADAFVFAFPTSNTLFRDDIESKTEEIESTQGNVSLIAGHPLGHFFKAELEYELGYENFRSTDDTASDFVLPEDTLTHTLQLSGRFSRSGYQLGLEASYSKRQKWEPWGLPGNTEFEPEQEDYLRWEVQASKSFYLPRFQRFAVEVDAFGGTDLDRFSKYQFGFFGGTRVHGYQSDRVRAEEGYAAHLSYGFEVGELFRLEAVGDAAWATDETSGLDNELLAGVGLVGQFMGPWQTLIQVDVGTPVAGPDDGLVAYIVFLKLFK